MTDSKPKQRPLTKSRFKTALKCPTQLYYGHRKDTYYDSRNHDDFLQSLADGGIQVGELAKFCYHPDPDAEGITVEATDYQTALAETKYRLARPGRVVIAEAAVGVPGYFVRVDILIKDDQTKTIEIIEVKSKSVREEHVEAGFRGKRGAFQPRWLPHIYDIAFQTVVAEWAFAGSGYQVVPKLLLIDREAECDMDGLNQFFRLLPEHTSVGRSYAKALEGTKAANLGNLASLREVEMGTVVNDMRNLPVQLVAPNAPAEHCVDLVTFMKWCASLQADGARFQARPHAGCKSCPYQADPEGVLSCGIHACWREASSRGWLQTGHPDHPRPICDADFSEPIATQLWGGDAGARSLAGEVLESGRAFLRDVDTDALLPKTQRSYRGLSPSDRRSLQVQCACDPSVSPFLAEAKLGEMDEWEWPLHMIDFETSGPAIPFFKGQCPYDTLAFQFSHHMMSRLPDGTIKLSHESEWISTEAGVRPNFEFVRQLRSALMPDGTLLGTVFRYHNHENTVLRKRRAELAGASEVEDADELIEFIDLITHALRDESDFTGPKDMVDLHRLVKHGYYSVVSGGSISLKRVLPAIISDAPDTRAFYSRTGIYGKGLAIDSLNFEDHIWIRTEAGHNPYKTLPPVFGPEAVPADPRLFRLSDYWDAKEAEEGARIEEGGVAMSAYNYTHFADLSDLDREQIRNALLRYCELDTLAMVMLVQGLFELRGKGLTIAC